MGTLWAADLNSAKELYAKKDYSAAIPVLQELVEKTPQNVQINEMLAVSLYKAGKHEQAKKYFEVAQKKGNAEAMLYLASYKYDAYDFDGCEELLGNYASALKKTNKEMGTEGNRMAAKVSKAKDMINHVEKIVVFDSLTVAKKDFFKSYKISPDVGYIKDTSVLNVISVTELFFVTKSIKGAIFRTYETFLISAAIYFILTLTVTRILKYFEKRMDRPREFIHASSTMPILFVKKPGDKNNGK